MSSLFALPDRFNTPIPLFGARVRSKPIPLDTTHFILTEEALVRKAEYSPTALNTTDSELNTAYLVSNDITEEQGDGVWTRRIYSSIPANRTEQIGSYSYTFPGLESGSSTSYAVSSSTGTVPTGPYVLTIGSHPFVTGNKILVTLKSVAVTSSGQTLTLNTSAVGAISAYTGTTVTVMLHFNYYVGGTVTFQTVRLFLRGDGQITIPSPAYKFYEYFLPGVTAGITTATDIVPNQVFTPFDSSTGNYVTALTAYTVPSSAEYLAMIAARDYIIVESVVEQYLGNILCRKTTFCQAK